MSDVCTGLGQPPASTPCDAAQARRRARTSARITGRWKVLCDVFRPRVTATGLPFEYVIEVTSRCNLRCPMCPREISPDLGNQDMDMETFRSVLDRIAEHTSFIWLAGLGEPMMNRHFLSMINECRMRGIATGASTNGTFLTDVWQERLLDASLDLLIVSFDGATRDTYEKIRVGASFEKVRDNVRRLAARKVGRGTKRPWLVMQMIELRQTKGEARQFRREWTIRGVDAIRVKKDELQFDDELAFAGQRKRQSDRPCPFLWRGTPLIQWDGTMLPCCYGTADKAFGNLKESSVAQLWNSQRLQAVRSAHVGGDGLREPFCRNCNTFQPGKAATAASVLTPSLTQKKHAGLVETLNRKIRFME